MQKWLICFLTITCAGCSTRPVANKPLATVLDSNKVTFSGAILDHDALQQLKQGTLSAEEWSNVLPVTLVPDTDKEMDEESQVQISGNYTINDTAIVFTAQKPFIKHRQYVARFYSSDNGLSYLKMAQSKQSLRGPEHIEFTFKIN